VQGKIQGKIKMIRRSLLADNVGEKAPEADLENGKRGQCATA
jgi:hypothetical protein